MSIYKFILYDIEYPAFFNEEKSSLEDVLPSGTLIEHIGSTAVVGLGGKGIVDIMVAVSSDIEKISLLIQQQGYEFRPNASTKNRLFFRKSFIDKESQPRRFNLHLTYINSKDFIQAIKFRDYLRTNPDKTEEYSEFKKEAVKQFEEKGIEYNKIKAPFIEKVLKKTT